MFRVRETILPNPMRCASHVVGIQHRFETKMMRLLRVGVGEWPIKKYNPNVHRSVLRYCEREKSIDLGSVPIQI